MLQSQPKEEFLRSWSGIAVLVDEETKGIEKDYAANRTKMWLNQAKLPGAIVGFLLLLGYIFYYTNTIASPFDYLFLLTKALGTIATLPLMIRLIDKNNPFIKKLCHTKKVSKADCASILDSSAAHFLGVFSWSEVGFLYFTTLFCYILLFPAHNNLLVAGLAVLAAPYTLYSIYYQGKVARQWCRLCLTVQAVLLLELGVAIAFFTTYSLASVGLESVIALALVSIIGIVGYSVLKPVLMDWNRFRQQVPQLNKIKYQPKVFRVLLEQHSALDTTDVLPLELGNPEGYHRLTIISNPRCGPCVAMHQELFELLKSKEDVSVQEIFLTNEDERSLDYRIARQMLSANPAAVAAYYHHFSHDGEAWIKKYDRDPGKCDIPRQTLAQHIRWCREKEISSTPTILYNGYPLPKEYTIEDLNYLLE